MTLIDPVLIISIAAVCVLLIILLLLLLWWKVAALAKVDVEQVKIELVRLLERNEEALRSGLSDSRRELREVSSENRREMNEQFKSFQDTMLRRVSENSSEQNRQLESFKSALNGLSEKLIGHSNEFRESVTGSFSASNDALNNKQDEFRERTIERLNHFQEALQINAKDNRQELQSALKSFETQFGESVKEFNEQLRLRFSDLHQQQQEAMVQAKASIAEIRESIEKQLKAIREDNSAQLTEMRKTVDEKLHDTLEKRLGESFKQVSDRLEQVHKGLGEMQTLAVGVGDLKKVLSNVKTRGILGEYQLGNILEQILTPDQYGVNVVIKPNSRDNVEYAVKLPGKSDEKHIWLPIDSKFPLESYQNLLLALEEGNPASIDLAQKSLLKTVETCAKDISAKYVEPPHSTDFAILFLPVESLYAEILRHPELFERLQRTYRVIVTGPTTLSALLSSLNMGFRTLAVQKRSSEVWKVLAEVKTEFVKYSEHLATVHKHLNTATTSLETLQTTRTNAMTRKLKSVDVLEFDVESAPALPDTPSLGDE